jgi:hypothetical protein
VGGDLFNGATEVYSQLLEQLNMLGTHFVFQTVPKQLSSEHIWEGGYLHVHIGCLSGEPEFCNRYVY